MRGIGSLHPTEGIPTPPDYTQTLLIAASSGQALDLPGSGSTGCIARFTGLSTAGAQMNFLLGIGTTKAAAPSSGNSSHGTTGFGVPVLGQGTFQIPGDSTCWSVAALSSGYVIAELWKKGG